MADTNYDFPIPTINGQAITVQWLVADPRRIYRILNTLVQQNLIGTKMLAGRVNLTGSGSAIYEINETIFADLNSATVTPLSEYPLSTMTPGVLAAVKPLKDGLAFEISDEDVAHNRIDTVMRNIIKQANTLVFKADGLFLAAILSKVTQTQNVTSGAWTTTGANPFLDLMLCGAQIKSQNKGYQARVVALNPFAYAYVVSRAAILNFIPRETADSVIATGDMVRIAGLTYMQTTNMPSGITAVVADPAMLGSIAWEALGGGYQGSPDPDSGTSGVEVKRLREDKRDGWHVQSRLVQAPMIQEPNSAVLIPTSQTGV